jgi:hypothetical protein
MASRWSDRLIELHGMMKSGKFQSIVQSLQNYLTKISVDGQDPQQADFTILLTQILIFSLYRIMEYKNARSLAKECINKVHKRKILGLGEGSHGLDEVPFMLKFIGASALF